MGDDGTSEDIDDLDLALIRVAQEGITISPRPYEALGEKLSLGEEAVLERLAALLGLEVIRRFSATIGHRALGIVANADRLAGPYRKRWSGSAGSWPPSMRSPTATSGPKGRSGPTTSTPSSTLSRGRTAGGAPRSPRKGRDL